MASSENKFHSLEYWYESCHSQFRTIGAEWGYSQEETNELVHVFFHHLLEKKINLSGVDNPQAYLAVAFKRKLIDLHRQKKDEFVEPSLLEESLVVSSPQEIFDELQSNAELVHKIRAAYKKLPDRCQKVIYLKFYKGLNTEQIALQTGLSKRSVYNNLFEGIKLLRADLNRAYPSVRVAALLNVLPCLITAGSI